MSAFEALTMARAAGLKIGLDGDDLVLEASTPQPATVLDALSRHKTDIVSLLRRATDGWSKEEWRASFDERAGIAEFDGGQNRAEAEILAFECCLTEWLNGNTVASSPDRCLACGGRDLPNDPLLPFGTDAHGHAWLHSGCWTAWYESRQADAAAALKAMGSKTRPSFQKISGKTEAHDGRFRIRTADRLRARNSRSLPVARREPASPERLPPARLAGRLAMDARRREGCLD